MKGGITGHQKLENPKTIDWINSALLESVIINSISFGCTSLAVGADQLFARILLENKIPYTAVIPCENYEKTFHNTSDIDSYKYLLQRSESTIHLEYSNPSEEAFLAAGYWIVNEVKILFAIWDGGVAKGLGGTGDVVDYAKRAGKKLVHINPETKTIS